MPGGAEDHPAPRPWTCPDTPDPEHQHLAAPEPALQPALQHPAAPHPALQQPVAPLLRGGVGLDPAAPTLQHLAAPDPAKRPSPRTQTAPRTIPISPGCGGSGHPRPPRPRWLCSQPPAGGGGGQGAGRGHAGLVDVFGSISAVLSAATQAGGT